MLRHGTFVRRCQMCWGCECNCTVPWSPLLSASVTEPFQLDWAGLRVASALTPAPLYEMPPTKPVHHAVCVRAWRSEGDNWFMVTICAVVVTFVSIVYSLIGLSQAEDKDIDLQRSGLAGLHLRPVLFTADRKPSQRSLWFRQRHALYTTRWP